MSHWQKYTISSCIVVTRFIVADLTYQMAIIRVFTMLVSMFELFRGYWQLREELNNDANHIP